MGYSLYVKALNASWIQIHAEEQCIHEELNEYFKFKDPNFEPNRFSKYDGFIRLYNKRNGKIQRGLLSYVLKFANQFKYDIELDPKLKNFRKITDEELTKFVDSLHLTRFDKNIGKDVKLIPYDYQYKALKRAIELRQTVELADTGAGKSLIIYMLTRYWIEESINRGDDPKIMIVVHRADLVHQLFENFKEYSKNDPDFTARELIHEITSGANKYSRCPIVITTFQSVMNEETEYFEEYTHLINDEVHMARSESLIHIAKCAVNAYDRMGTTGTLYSKHIHQLQVQACYGKIVNVVDTKELQRLGQAAKTQIYMVRVAYPQPDLDLVAGKDFRLECETTYMHPERNRILADMVAAMHGHTLVVCVEKDHQALLEELLKERGCVTRMINGDIKDRDVIYDELDTDESDIVLIATYGTISTGISVNMLHHAVFAASRESNVSVLQTVGRMVRTHKTKKVARIIDFVDDFSCSKNATPALKRHGGTRYGYYVDKGHPVKFIRKDVKKALPDDIKATLLSNFNRRERAREYKKMQQEKGIL